MKKRCIDCLQTNALLPFSEALKPVEFIVGGNGVCREHALERARQATPPKRIERKTKRPDKR